MEKRGQVTIFIVLGIVILGVIGVVYLIQSNLLDYYLGIERARVNVPSEIQPVEQFLELCLQEKVENGLDKMAKQGGYLELESGASKTFDDFSNTLEVYSGYKVAYWYYEDASGKPREQVPSLSNMQNQLNKYLEVGFQDCLSELGQFEQEGYSITIKEDLIKADVKIDKENVNVVVRAPIEVEYKGVGAKIPRHVVNVDSGFGSLFEQAVKLFENNNKESWLENKTLSYIYDYKDNIPQSDVEFTCSPIIWNLDDIKNDYQDILELNVPFYVVKNSEDSNYYDSDPGVVWDAGSGFEKTKVYFEYDKRWPFELNVEDSDGGVLISQPFEGGIPIINFCTNYYNYFYDVKHPILISLENDKNEEFRFATQIVIRNNEPRRQIDLDKIEYQQYCDTRDGLISVTANSFDENNLPVDVVNADVYYKCLDHICYLGNTNSEGTYEGSSPSCLGGIIEVRKDGYTTFSSQLDVYGEEASIFVKLNKEKSLNYEVMTYQKSGTSLINQGPLKANEKALIQIDNLDTGETEFVGFYPDSNTSLSLAEGRYGITTKLIYEGNANLAAKEIKTCNCAEILSVCPCGEQTINLPSKQIENPVIGGSYVEVFITNEEIQNNNKILFYSIDLGVPNDYDDIATTYDHKSISIGVEGQIEPSFE